MAESKLTETSGTEATVEHRGITATVRIDDYPEMDGYVTVHLDVSPNTRGLAEQDTYIGHVKAPEGEAT